MLTGETVTRLRYATADDRYGNPVLTGDPVELNISGAVFDPGGSSEPVEVGRTAVVTQPTLYFPRQWPDVLAADRMRVRGVVFEVIGDPGDWRSAAGSPLGGLVVPLKRVEG